MKLVSFGKTIHLTDSATGDEATIASNSEEEREQRLKKGAVSTTRRKTDVEREGFIKIPNPGS